MKEFRVAERLLVTRLGIRPAYRGLPFRILTIDDDCTRRLLVETGIAAASRAREQSDGNNAPASLMIRKSALAPSRINRFVTADVYGKESKSGGLADEVMNRARN